jgi:hypothetical protein
MKKFVLYKHLGRNFPNNKIYYSGSIYTSQYNQQNVYIENATIFTNEELREFSTRISKNKWIKGELETSA